MAMYGYRAETDSRRESRIERVLQFELFELCNTDSLVFMLQNHAEIFDPQSCVIISNMITRIDSGEPIGTDYQVEFCTGLLNCINASLKRKYKYCLWLCSSADAVRQLYAHGNAIDQYEVSDFCASNLGFDGALFFYEKLPKPIRSFY